MKDLLRKEHYCYKMHTSLMKNSASPPFYRQTPYMVYPQPAPPFLPENLDPPFYDFPKISPLGGIHTMLSITV